MNLLAGLDDYIETARADWQNVGLAVAVARRNEVIYARGFGVKESGEAARIDTDTLFQVGSTTKAFATAALGILVDEGKLHWDDPVVRHLPGFQLQDPWLTRNVTIRDAVAHRTGIPVSYYPFLSIMGRDETLDQLRFVSAETAFRDSFLYSNLMYAVVGRIIEAVSGMTWNDFVSLRLLQPLKMLRSGTSPYEFWDSRNIAPTFLGSAPAGQARAHAARGGNLAMPHGCAENGSVITLCWQSYDNAAAAGSIISSANDMAAWLVMNLNEGRIGAGQLLKKETLLELHSTQNLHAGINQFPFSQGTESYAMGWFKSKYRGHVHLSHGGGIIGFPAYMALLPDEGAGIVVLSNGANVTAGLHKSIAFWVFDKLLGAPSRNWSEDFLSRFRSVQHEQSQMTGKLHGARLAKALPSLPLSQYAGTYQDRSNPKGTVSIRIQDDQLMLRFAGEGAYAAQLKHWHGDLFQLHAGAAVNNVLGPQFVAFVIDPSGKAASLTAFNATFVRVVTSG